MILDVTCGARLMWHNKHHPGVIYADQRATHHQLSDGRQITISPNIQCDYRALPFRPTPPPARRGDWVDVPEVWGSHDHVAGRPAPVLR